jgi:tRNA A37 N6-isopentenylltransferase MiaA
MVSLDMASRSDAKVELAENTSAEVINADRRFVFMAIPYE